MNRRRALMMIEEVHGDIPNEYQKCECVKKSANGPYLRATGITELPVGAEVTIKSHRTDTATNTIRCPCGDNASGFEPYYRNSEIKVSGGALISVTRGTPYDVIVASPARKTSALTVFAYNPPNYVYNFIGFIYGITAKSGGAVLLDLVPCYRKSDGEIGMYDTVSRQFFKNLGTGSFAKGADVN